MSSGKIDKIRLAADRVYRIGSRGEAWVEVNYNRNRVEEFISVVFISFLNLLCKL